MLSLLVARHQGDAHSTNRIFLLKLCIVLLMSILVRNGRTQETSFAADASQSLARAPGRAQLESKEVSSPVAQATSALSGMVVDSNGGSLPNAAIALMGANNSAERTTVAGSNGEFSFNELHAGTYKLTITSVGMERLVMPEIVIGEAEVRRLPQINMAIASTTTEVQVVVTQVALAQEQVKAAEHQRVLGIVPNFYSSYLWNAAPLDTKQKFNLAFHSISDPVAFLAIGAIAGAEQVNNSFAGYGKGPQGYAKRYGAAYADEVVGRLIGSAILPSLLHQDPRYFYKGSGTVRSRALYALSRSIVTRGDNGREQPNYSRLLGSFAAGGLANLYYPQANRGVGLTLGNAFVGIAGHAADNLLREFLLRRLTPNVPDYATGKP